MKIATSAMIAIGIPTSFPLRKIVRMGILAARLATARVGVAPQLIESQIIPYPHSPKSAGNRCASSPQREKKSEPLLLLFFFDKGINCK